jgi:hypothetical protein
MRAAQTPPATVATSEGRWRAGRRSVAAPSHEHDTPGRRWHAVVGEGFDVCQQSARLPCNSSAEFHLVTVIVAQYHVLNARIVATLGSCRVERALPHFLFTRCPRHTVPRRWHVLPVSPACRNEADSRLEYI